MTEYDPRLVAPACLYLASKAEESTVQARHLVFYIKKLCKQLNILAFNLHFLSLYTPYMVLTCHFIFSDSDDKYRYEIKDILEMEMKVLEALNYYLVVFHPYRAYHSKNYCLKHLYVAQMHNQYYFYAVIILIYIHEFIHILFHPYWCLSG